MRHTIMTALAVGVLLLGATACGEDDDSGDKDAEKAAASLASSMEREEQGEAEKKQNACMATAIVDKVGVEKLQEEGVLTDELTGKFGVKVDQEVAEAFGDAAVECYDFAAIVAERKSALPSATDEDWATYIACVDKLDAQLRASVVEANVEGAPATARKELDESLLKCGNQLARNAQR